MNTINPINCNSGITPNYHLSFKAKKLLPEKDAFDIITEKIIPLGAGAVYCLTQINTKSRNQESQPKQLQIGPPSTLEEMRARYAYKKCEANNPVIQELEDELASLDPKKVVKTKHYGNRYYNDNNGFIKIYLTAETGTEKHYDRFSIGRYMIDEFYGADSSIEPIGMNYYHENGDVEIVRMTDDGRYITKKITKDNNAVIYSVDYGDDSDYKDKEVTFDSNGTVIGIYFKITDDNGDELLIDNYHLGEDYTDKYSSVSHDENGNITLTTMTDLNERKFVVIISKTGEINGVKEIPSEEKYTKEFFKKRPEFKTQEKYWKDIIGPYGLDDVSRQLLGNLEFINVLQDAKNKDGTRRFTESNIIDFALVDPDFGTEKFIKRYLTTDEDIHDIWGRTFH